MSSAIQPLRRSILSKTKTLIQFLQIQLHFQKPISCFPQFLCFQSPIQPQIRNFGSVVSETRKSAFENLLLRLLRNEIQYELDHLQQHRVEFNGFKVDERPGEEWVSLGKFFGKSEEIKVEVTVFDGSVPLRTVGDKPGLPVEEVHLHITMIISILKKDSNRVLEFICSAWPDALEIRKLFVREKSKSPTKQPYTGPAFWELDDELQDALNVFLEERGIDNNFCVRLHNYITYKDKAEYVRWMESVQSLLERK
ncbi:hypothetical protein RND81_14G188900 [Saponaria officinalis]|uniref:Mitochondrial glycoprotein n=1 Tax=Saponaria officinalis TaxID=3572 RepID=A0AAW1GPT3_SAPOF